MQPNNVGKRRRESLLQGLTGALRKTSRLIAACSLWSRACVYKRAIAACRLRATPDMTVICSARAPEASRAPDAHRLRARVLKTHDAHLGACWPQTAAGRWEGHATCACHHDEFI